MVQTRSAESIIGGNEGSGTKLAAPRDFGLPADLTPAQVIEFFSLPDDDDRMHQQDGGQAHWCEKCGNTVMEYEIVEMQACSHWECPIEEDLKARDAKAREFACSPEPSLDQIAYLHELAEERRRAWLKHQKEFKPGDTPSTDFVGSLSTSSLNPSSLNKSDSP